MILSKGAWDLTPVPQRVVNCQAVGLPGRVGSKEWDDLEHSEMLVIMGLEAPTYEDGAVVEKSEAEREYWDNKRAGMRSIASDIVSQILANK